MAGCETERKQETSQEMEERWRKVVNTGRERYKKKF